LNKHDTTHWEACSPLPYKEWGTDRTYARYYPSKVGSNKPILPKTISIAVIRTELVRQDDAEYGDYRENLLRHIVVKNITRGSVSLRDHAYPHDPSIKETYLEPNFQTWEKGTINTPQTTIGSGTDSCGGIYPRMTLKPDGLYLAFLKQYADGTSFIISAAPIKTIKDEIVKAYKKIAENAPDAPHRMNAETYFNNMDDFIELEVLECPKSGDFGYTDSRFSSADKQVDVLYRHGERTRDPHRPFDLRDAFFYFPQLNGQRNLNVDRVKCSFGDRYLYVAGYGPKYLKIENGLIDTSKIGTRIDITENNLVNVTDVKNWIR